MLRADHCQLKVLCIKENILVHQNSQIGFSFKNKAIHTLREMTQYFPAGINIMQIWKYKI